MKNIITVKIEMEENVPINEQLYLDIINGLNDRLVPVTSISVNDKIVFTNVKGFRVNEQEN